ncbi:MAG: hypothetical protein ACE5DI_05125, partial [Candidatus Micrarchaeia archaeon]
IKLKLRFDFSFFVFLFVVVIVFFQLITSAFFPFYAYDAIATYSPLAFDVFSTEKISFPGYPLFVPVLYSVVYFFAGSIQQHLAHALVPIAGALTVFFAVLISRRLNANSALTALLLVLPPWFLIHFNSGYADIFVAMLSAAALYYAAEFAISKNSSKKLLVLSALFAALAIHSKVQALYLLGGLPLALFIGLMLSKRVNKTKLFVVTGAFSLLIFVAALFYVQSFNGEYYLTATFSKHSAGQASDLEWLWGKERASNYLLRLPYAVGVFVVQTPFPIWLLVGFGVLFGFFEALKRNVFAAMIISFTFVFMFLWALLLSFEVRHLSLTFPLLAVLASRSVFVAFEWISVFMRKKLKRFSRFLNPVLVIVFLFLFLNPAVFATESSLRGYTTGGVQSPSLFWTFEHLFDSDDDKLSTLLGDMYKTVVFLKNDPDVAKGVLLTMDPRVMSFLPNQNFSVEGASYLLFIEGGRFSHWNKPSWAETVAEEKLRAKDSEFFEEVFSSGAYFVFKINDEKIAEFS